MALDEFDFCYHDEMQYFCLKNCFYQLMDYYSIENALLNIKLGLKLKITCTEDNFYTYKHENLLPLYDMDAVEYGCGKEFDEIFHQNLDNLPVIVLVDVYYLPYRKEHLQYHASHAVILTDYSANEEIVKIIDWYAPYFYKGGLSLQEYKLARTSPNLKDVNPFSGFSINNYWYKLSDKQGKDLTIETVHRNLGDFICSECNDERKIYTGAYAVDKIVNEIEKGLGNDAQAFPKLCKHIHDELFLFYRSFVLAEKYFELANSCFSHEFSFKICEYIPELSQLLSKSNFYLLKGSMANSEKMLIKAQNVLNTIKSIYNNL